MRFITPLLCLAIMAMNHLSAEGTRQVAPNGVIDIMGSSTNDVAALHINNPSYNSFATYDSPNPQSRLYIHLKNPSIECIYLGFNWAHNNITSANPPRINFEYRIKDPNGNVVFGPVAVTPAGANIQNWSQGWTGPMQLHGPGGYNAVQASSLDLTSQGWFGEGDYYIEFRDEEDNDLLIDYWDITVADCSTLVPVEKTGRLWSYNWSIFAINDFGFPNRPFNGAFFVCAPDPDNVQASFVTKIDFNGSGFRPAAFNIAFNSFGIQNTGNVSEDRKSVELVNATQAEYAIFLNDPVDICATAEIGGITILGISRCTGEDYCIKFTATKAGQIDLLLDFDGADNIYTPGTADVMVSHQVTPDEVGVPTCVAWDGKDGLGHPLSEDVGTQIPITIAFAQGIYHFPIYDAEYMTNGFRIEAVRPAASIPSLYYDDSNISVPSGSGEPAVQLSGCTAPCHRWLNYTQPNTPGFGNLHTINSWWFSQLIVRQDVFFLPSYYTCEIEGPTHFCQGGTSQLTFKPQVSPAGAAGGEIVSTIWSGPGIVGANNGSSITISAGGGYNVDVRWLTSLGDTCGSSCQYEVTMDPALEETIDTLIVQGQTIEINGETYNEGGQYIQDLTSVTGCDSILTINIIVLNTVIHYDLNDCESFMSNGSQMDYSEFVPIYPEPLSCATITADTLYRTNPQMNKHSCTPGVNNTIGMCVTALDGCTYQAGSSVNVVIDLSIIPDPDTAVHLTGLSFFQKAPLTYNWISGPTGPNNYPTLFGLRVLKNGTEIYRKEAIPTSPNWKEEVFDFLADDQFLVKNPTTFRFELLSYCLVGNGAAVAVWDLDEISLVASCASQSGLNKSISGLITTPQGAPLSNVEVHLANDISFNPYIPTLSQVDGNYLFGNLIPENNYYLNANKNNDFLNGVSTLDLIYIQKHLLGIKPFTSAYQMIAADANRSNSVSAIDLLELRKLILGIYPELPHNTSWRFGLAHQNLDAGYPWVLQESYSIEYLGENLTDVDFVGIKIGDINGDVKTGIKSSEWIPRSPEELVLQMTNQQVTAGVPVKVDFTSAQFHEVSGLQLALKANGGQIQEIVNGVMEVTKDDYTISQDGVVRLSWTSIDPVSASGTDILFSLLISPDKSGSVKEMLQIKSDVLHAEAYIGDQLEQKDISLEPCAPGVTSYRNQLFQNEPNPFSQSTTVRFSLLKSGHGVIRFFDLSGRLLAVKTGEFSKGNNAIEISKVELGVSNGVILCQLQSEGFVATQKMVMIK